MEVQQGQISSKGGHPVENFWRTTEFWRRATGIYLSYKGAQVRAAVLRARGLSSEEIKERLWTPHHCWAGDQMYSLAVDLRGFYLKASADRRRDGTGFRSGISPPPPPLPSAHSLLSILLRYKDGCNIPGCYDTLHARCPRGSRSGTARLPVACPSPPSC